jgi:hypothetical protein
VQDGLYKGRTLNRRERFFELAPNAWAVGAAPLSQSPTLITPVVTQMGLVRGTAACMSPGGTGQARDSVRSRFSPLLTGTDTQRPGGRRKMASPWKRTTAVLGLALAAGESVSAEHIEAVTLNVFVRNHGSVAADTLNRAKANVLRIYRDIGVEVVWLDQFDRSDRLWTDETLFKSMVTVHLFSQEMMGSLKVRQGVMGQAVSGTRVVKVFHARIEQIAKANAQEPGCVLGHVMAHEIGHLLLPPDGHSTGIMQSELDLRLAANGALYFRPNHGRVIRRSLAPAR